MADLCCVPVPIKKRAELAHALLAASTFSFTPRKPKMRTLKRRLHTLKAGAAPSLSGWRNAHLLNKTDRPYGYQAILGFAASSPLAAGLLKQQSFRAPA